MRTVVSGIRRERTARLALSWAYIASMAVALAGLFVPFVQQGCPANGLCLLLKLYLPHTALAQGQDGPILLALVVASLALGLLAVPRPSMLLLGARLIVSLATLAVACLDTFDLTRVVHLSNPYGFLVLAPGFVVVIIGAALGSFLALVLLAFTMLRHRSRRSSTRIVAA